MNIPIPWTLSYRLAQRVFMGRLDVRVRVHEAALLQPYQTEAFFINVTNHSPKRTARPTHVLVNTKPRVSVLNSLRPFRPLAPDGDAWETWIEKSALPDPRQDIRALVEVRLSTGQAIMSVPSTPGVDMPDAGAVPE